MVCSVLVAVVCDSEKIGEINAHYLCNIIVCFICYTCLNKLTFFCFHGAGMNYRSPPATIITYFSYLVHIHI